MSSKQVVWLSDYGSKVGWLDPNTLPPYNKKSIPPVSTLFNSFERITDLFTLRDQLPGGENLLSDMFA